MNAYVDPCHMTTEQHRVWWDSLTEDEKTVAHVPVGYQHTLLFIAFIKYILTTQKMNAGYRLRYLEWINNMVDMYIRPEMLAAIEPMSETEVKMFLEAKSLDQEHDEGGLASYRVLTRWDVFNKFLALNPSLLTAIKMRETQRSIPNERNSKNESRHYQVLQ